MVEAKIAERVLNRMSGSLFCALILLATTGDAAPEVKRHWAYVKPERPVPQKVQDAAWVKNPIDKFILARLETEKLRPGPEANKETLIRRVSLDVTGLPPSVEDVEDFLRDNQPDAYENLVDRLLASTHYGEHWARKWLDLARYADSNGYERDRTRSIWPYRDWVIEAFNKNLPFDEFTIEQIAGDLLPSAKLKQVIATGFLRNTMINDEPGTDPEEFRVAAVVDRVNNIATLWLATTLECAQCHDHKYDPFSQEDYYRFLAFFNNDEPDVETDTFNTKLLSWGPQVELPSPEQASQRQKLSDEIGLLERTVQTQTPELDIAEARWEHGLRVKEPVWTVLNPTSFSSVAGTELAKADDKSLVVTGQRPEDVFLVDAETDQTGITGMRLEVRPEESSAPEIASSGFVLSGFKVEASPTVKKEEAPSAPLLSAAKPHEVVFSLTLAERFSDKGFAVFDRTNQEAVFIVEPFGGFKPGTKLKIMLRCMLERQQQMASRIRLSFTTAEHPGIRLMKPTLSIPSSQRTDLHKQELAAYFRAVTPLLQPVRDRLALVRESLNNLEIPTTLVMKQSAQPRRSHVLLRGNFLNHGKEVWPGVPASLHPLVGVRRNRLALARWLVDLNNPLVARVTVNRFWEQIFGRGIVETSEDFGTRGESPSHPELLDWLATEFVRSGWDVKALLRLMLTSATYRQSSRVTAELLERDPYNRLLARGSRFRVEAETVRDIALAVGGLLNRRIGGPSVFPPQPEGILQNSFGFYELNARWVSDTDENRYRRGLYTFWRRTAPYPSFLTFDAPRREVCTVKRSRTNTPLQALTALNDPAFVEAAVGLAQRIMMEVPPNVRNQAIYGFRLCVSRAPDSDEVTSLIALYNKTLRRFNQQPRAAEALVTSYPFKPRRELNARELAAWVVVSKVLLNLDETITKG